MTSRAQHAALPLILVAVCLVGAGCASSPTGEPSPAVMTTSPTPPPSVSPTPDPIEQAKAEVLAVYSTFIDARNKSLHDPTKRPDGRLDMVSTGEAKRDLFSLAFYYRKRGMAIRGDTVSSARVSSLSGTAGAARILDCVDGSNAIPIIAATGKSVLAPNQSSRLLVDVNLAKATGSWMISSWVPRRNQPC